ncbi:hypothetical protein CVV65_01260 [Kyrpidia spormannii]|uniref:Uncharacterized protein n=1 Tax=Kyrpidia spormannii TaxID=2055160 RepID=A0A2K8N4E9_9BACL|nr:TFIIB-type zinc finger domain-containing protein [Kyrpidia sp.]ATY83777.1 hypothetical protein CVV65_01260 [Kyrpidia spormannii]MCL6575645.1 TFIIB-type zinc finger domain-containing protein [Kyrpidia sp.]
MRGFRRAESSLSLFRRHGVNLKRMVGSHMVCPVCGKRTVGKIGGHHYYCRECCHVIQKQGDQIKVYEISEDGKLTFLRTAG